MEGIYGRRVSLVFMLVFWVKPTLTKGNNFETRLFQKLFENYHTSVRPAWNQSEAVEVKLGMSLQQIRDLDPRKGSLFTHMWLNMQWKDYRLQWNESDYGGIKSIRVDTKFIWIPDIQPYNGQITYLSTQDTVILFSSGSAIWLPSVNLETSCSVDLTKFPFDQQTCHINVGSWTNDVTKLDTRLLFGEVDISNYPNDGTFVLINRTAQRNLITYHCCPEGYVILTFGLTLKRMSTYATHMLVAPSVILALLLPVLFLLPPEGSRKLQIGTGMLISHAMLLSVFSSMIPIDHFSLPLLGVFHVINIILICFAIACCAVISNIWTKSDRNVKMPNMIRTVFLGICGRLLCVSQNDFINGDQGIKDQTTSEKDRDEILESSYRAIASAQWRQLAVILDRLCFVLFALIALITVIRFAAY